MRSLIKRVLSPAAVEKRLLESTGVGWRVERELTDGWFNAAYLVVASDGSSAVVKISPAADASVLRYERGILDTEAMFYRRVTEWGGVPTPELLHVEPDFLLVSTLEGDPWSRVAERLPDGARGMLLREIGGVVARLHALTSDEGRFGCPAPQAGLSSRDWRTAFTAMVEAILEDAERWESPLGVTRAEVLGFLEAGANALDEVRRPSLVHFDLWPGNIFIATGSPSGGDAPRLVGIIDHERAFWGDPVAELVSLEICGDIGPGSDFLSGYIDGGGRLEFTPATLGRLALYRLYFCLILVVECGPRGYTAEHLAWCRAKLDAAVGELRELTRL
ncbi:aminoglycoside phosphotransferase family protein [Streptomyces sp. NBC_01275]|uniref:phosphotransferase family protein n=1 Tax=Streptomyces sp. NBC_01275 TaxID=2903807 RepID=UPI002252A98C|nr:aminoglycoside phosphotransferase family protein [Streptomyces sp. NBC_01275]MCX4763637.1 aminoglycoside phosphotransferase family protein [Streptomyces sp. NBC_01275]